MAKRASKFAWQQRIQQDWFKYRCKESAALALALNMSIEKIV